MNKPIYKPKMKVRVIKNESGHGFKIGEIVTLKEIGPSTGFNENEFFWKVEGKYCENPSFWFWLSEKEFTRETKKVGTKTLTKNEKIILDRLLRLIEDSDFFSSTGTMPGTIKTDEEVTKASLSIRKKLKI